MCALKAALVSQFSIHLEYENLGREETELSLAVNSNDHIEVTGETLSLSKFAHSAGSSSGSDDGDGVSWISKKLSIIYFDVPGRAESLRMAAVVSNVSILHCILPRIVNTFL